MKKFISNITVASLAFLPMVASAQKSLDPTVLQGDVRTQAGALGYQTTATGDAKALILSVINWVLGFLGLAAVILIIYGGILWMTSAGEDKRAKQGKMVIKNAVIGLAIILGAYVIVNFVIASLIQVTK